MFVVIVVWFCCSSWLAFLVMANLINLMLHFLTSLCYQRWRLFFINISVWKILDWIFGGFLSVPHLVDIYAKNVDERVRNFMCKRTLPILLVALNKHLSFTLFEIVKKFSKQTQNNQKCSDKYTNIKTHYKKVSTTFVCTFNRNKIWPEASLN